MQSEKTLETNGWSRLRKAGIAFFAAVAGLIFLVGLYFTFFMMLGVIQGISDSF